jgi:hypothetical protein
MLDSTLVNFCINSAIERLDPDIIQAITMWSSDTNAYNLATTLFSSTYSSTQLI